MPKDMSELFGLIFGMVGAAGILFWIFASPLWGGQILQWASQAMTHFNVTPPTVSAFLYGCLMVGAYIKQKVRLTYKVTRDTWLINILIACAIPFTAWNLFTA